MSAQNFKYSRQAKQQPGAMADGGIPIAKLIGPLLRSVKLDEQARMGVLEEQWAAAVGKAIATHTRPGILIEKELTIFVDSSPWLSELHRMQRDVLAKLQATFGRDKILRIRLQLDPGKP
jgi:predicted nucleic acid-binding Zn ribbon protein